MEFKFILLCLFITLFSHHHQPTTADDEPEYHPDVVSTQASPTTTNVPSTTTKPPTPVSPPSKPNKKKGPECPVDCDCSSPDKILCEGKKLKTISNLSKFNAVEIRLRNNEIEQLDFNLLPVATLEILDLSNNYVKTFSGKNINLNKLKLLDLGNNRIENLTSFSNFKLPALEVLYLHQNPLKELVSSSFSNTRNLLTLNLSSTKLKSIDAQTFAPLTQLKVLNMSSIGPNLFDNPNLFSSSSKLDTLDISNNSLIEIPPSLRNTAAIKTLILNMNSITSIRQSDLLNRQSLVNLEISWCKSLTNIDGSAFGELNNLKKLIISNNRKLHHISKDAFEPRDSSTSTNLKQLDLLDISGNNLTTIFDPQEISTTFAMIVLSNNPWHCDCSLKWMRSTQHRSPAHCKTPKQVSDLEVNEFFKTKDCEFEESGYHAVILSGFILFLLGLLVAVYVQKSEICRRLWWKDQYGTIYYTKASFPPETV